MPAVLHFGGNPPETNAPPTEAPGKVVSVALVQSPEGSWPEESNVQVIDSNGKTTVLTSDGRDSRAKAVGDGMVGWVNAIGHDASMAARKRSCF